MAFLSTWRTQQAARRDAGLGINSMEAHVVALLGPRPAIDPNNLHQAGRLAAGRAAPERRDWDDDHRIQQAAAVEHISPTVILPALVLIALIELWGGVRVMAAVGVGRREQLPFGLALAFFLLVLTLAVSRRAAAGAASTVSWARRCGTAVLFAVYATVVAALAYSRAQEAGAQVSNAALWSEVVIMLAATVGPAWLTEILWDAFRNARRVKRDLSRLERDIRRDDRRRAQGTTYAARFGVSVETWDRAAAEIRAIYTIEHRRVTATVLPTQPTLPVLGERRDP